MVKNTNTAETDRKIDWSNQTSLKRISLKVIGEIEPYYTDIRVGEDPIPGDEEENSQERRYSLRSLKGVNTPISSILTTRDREIIDDHESRSETFTFELAAIMCMDEENFDHRLANLQEVNSAEAAKKAYEREDLGELDGFNMEAIPADVLKPSEPEIPEKIYGTEEMKDRIKVLLSKYLSVFSKQVRAEPAKVSPLVIDVDRKRWEVIRNRLPARKLGSLRDAELERQCEMLLKMGVIEISKGGYYSYAFLVPKPNGD